MTCPCRASDNRLALTQVRRVFWLLSTATPDLYKKGLVPMKAAERWCEKEGCKRLGMPCGGGRRKKLCSKHHRLKYGMTCKPRPSNWHNKRGRKMEKAVLGVSKQPCSRCGWNASYCDRHRLVPSVGYVEGNVIPLCPNCHRVEHRGMIRS